MLSKSHQRCHFTRFSSLRSRAVKLPNSSGFRGCVRTRNRHPEGRKRARAVFSGRVALRDLVVCKCLIRFHHQRKVPHPYSGADDSAPSLTGFGMTPFGCVGQFSHTPFSPWFPKPRKTSIAESF